MGTNFEKYHSVIFSLVSAIGLELIAIFYTFQGINSFIILTVLFFMVFVIESYFSYQYASQLKSKLPLPHLVDEIKHIHISHHILLPFLLYSSICAFIFFNGMLFQTQLIIFIGMLTFFSIFEGQRTSFRKEFIFDEPLHYIYDSIKIIIYFLGIDCIIQGSIYFSWNQLIFFILSEVLAFTLFLLIIVRKSQFNSIGMLYIFAASVLISLVTLTLMPHVTIATAAILSSVLYYLLVGLIHHKINASLTAAVISEYVIIALIVILAVKGIS